MPRRATSTSFGAERGNKPQSPGPGRQPGLSPEQLKRALAWRASQVKTLKRLDEALESKDHYEFLAAWDRCLERGYGKVAQTFDIDLSKATREQLIAIRDGKPLP